MKLRRIARRTGAENSTAGPERQFGDARQRGRVVLRFLREGDHPIIAGRLARAKLLVVPHMTTPALGLMVLRRAAAMSIPDREQTTQEFLTADSVVRAAQAQSASWATAQPLHT